MSLSAKTPDAKTPDAKTQEAKLDNAKNQGAVIPSIDPVSLSYVTAIRGFRPRIPGEPFLYATFGLHNPKEFCALAASNPEGHFIGFATDQMVAIEASEWAFNCGLKNALFDAATPTDLSQQLRDKIFNLPKLDYLVCSDLALMSAPNAPQEMASIASETIMPGGILAVRYRTSKQGQRGILQGLLHAIRSAGGDMLSALKHMCIFAQSMLEQHADIKLAVEMAISDGDPTAAFKYAADQSRTFDVMEAMKKAGFSYVGQADIKLNYLEMAARPETHDAILQQRGKPFYEMAKDAAMGLEERTDLFVLEPAEKLENMVVLFGGFAFGIPQDAADLPQELETPGSTFSLSPELTQKIIGHLADIPCTIGDLLSSSNIQSGPLELLSTVQLLVAGGIAQIMRTPYMGGDGSNLQSPKLKGGANAQLRDLTPAEIKAGFAFSSEVMGRSWHFSGLEALIIREIDRTGFGTLPSVLAENIRLFQEDPRLSGWNLASEEERVQAAAELIGQICQRNLVYWFAYGVFES